MFWVIYCRNSTMTMVHVVWTMCSSHSCKLFHCSQRKSIFNILNQLEDWFPVIMRLYPACCIWCLRTLMLATDYPPFGFHVHDSTSLYCGTAYRRLRLLWSGLTGMNYVPCAQFLKHEYSYGLSLYHIIAVDKLYSTSSVQCEQMEQFTWQTSCGTVDY
jgi:hypothetical protein